MDKKFSPGKKTKDRWISFHKHSIEPETQRKNNAQVERLSQFKLLGVWQQNNLRWNYHVEQTIKKACKRLYHLRECRKARLPTEVVYCTKIRPLLEYVSQVWGGLPQYLADDLQSIQNRCQYNRYIENISPNVGAETNGSNKTWIGKNDRRHQPSQSSILVSYSYNLRFQSGPVVIPRSGTQRHANSYSKSRKAAKFLNVSYT